jgi:HPt (histidine-containing phosphotransfer) domain-containing protein
MARKQSSLKLNDELKIQIRNEFVQGTLNSAGMRTFPSIESLVKKFSVSQSTLYRVSRQENWKQEKEQFMRTLEAKLDEERLQELAEEGKKFDSTSVNLAKALMATVAQNIRQNNEAIANGQRSFIPSQVHALANAALSAQRLAKLALGETTHNVEINANIQENAFRDAMELLDELEASKRDSVHTPTH